MGVFGILVTLHYILRTATLLVKALHSRFTPSDRLPSLRVNCIFAGCHDSSPIGTVTVDVKEGPAVES
jgi:hypothetical protein